MLGWFLSEEKRLNVNGNAPGTFENRKNNGRRPKWICIETVIAPRWCDCRRNSSYSFRKKDFCRCPCSEIIVWPSETPNVDIKFTGISCISVLSGNCNRTERILYSSRKKQRRRRRYTVYGVIYRTRFRAVKLVVTDDVWPLPGSRGGGDAGTLDESRKVKTESRVP